MMKSKRWRVSYFYLATGMEAADTKDYGVVEAPDAQAAKEIVVMREYPAGAPESSRVFLRSCLSATKVSEQKPRRWCKCGHCYWCPKCKRWVPDGWVCESHAEETRARPPAASSGTGTSRRGSD